MQLKGPGSRQRQRDITHQLPSQAKETQLGEISLIYCQSN